MSLRNRVTPDGMFISNPTRGLFMGNRGILHDGSGRLTHRTWQHKHWIICRTSFKGRRRKLLSPGRYTELFFLDEATALAAGHRPCCECRRAAYTLFLGTLKRGMGDAAPDSAGALDDMLHRERAVPRRFVQKTWRARLGSLPDGTMFKLEDGGPFLLLWKQRVHLWTPDGYRETQEAGKCNEKQTVQVVTPRTTVTALAFGYVPALHPSLSNN